MPTSVVLPKAQELALEALIGSGSYKTQSEVLRSALEDFLHHAPQPTLVAAAVWAYEKGHAGLSQAAALANVPHEEMHRILVREGHFKGAATSAKQLAEEADFLASHAKPRKSKGAKSA